MITDKPKRIQLSRRKGFKLPPNTVAVGRPHKYGNPFTVLDYGQWGAIARFEEMLAEGKTPPFSLADIRTDLRGKNLACWCPAEWPCHADVLLKIANA